MRLCYPDFENEYNKANYQEAIKRMNSVNDKGVLIDDWHKRLWWDKYDINVK